MYNQKLYIHYITDNSGEKAVPKSTGSSLEAPKG